MLCVKCKKNMAVVYIKKLEAGKQTTEGYCIPCANELGISPLNDMMKYPKRIWKICRISSVP